MGTPTVSVIIPTYNTADFIGETLDSVFAQTYSSFEVIVVNDGSPDTDKLERVLEPYRQRITYLLQGNKGPGAARNLAIQHARGEFLAFLDSDDIWLPSFLAEQLRLFEVDPALDLVYCDFWFFGDTPSAGKTFMHLYPPKSETVNLENLVTGDNPTIYPSCVLVRRETVIDAGLFDEDFSFYCEDLDLWLRIACRGGRLTFQRKTLAARRAWSGSSNTARSKVANGYLRVLVKLLDARELSPAARTKLERRIAQHEAAINLWNAKQYLATGDFVRANDSFEKANAFLHHWKLLLVIFGMRTVPELTRFGVRAWLKLDGSVLALLSLKSTIQSRCATWK